MPYASPLHILPPEEFASNEATGDAFLLRLRKKLLAEYNLTNNPELIINGKAYTKDSIIKTIDVLLGNPDLPLHIYIFKDRALLDFLEGKSNRFNFAAFTQHPPPEDLQQPIYHLLVEQALSLYKRAVQARDFGEAQAMLALARQMPGHQTDEYYHVIYNSLENIRGLVRSEKESDLRNSPKKLDFIKTHAFSVLLNSLGEEFIDTINSLVADIINFLVAYQKAPKVDKGFLYTVSTMLTKVKCDSELEALIKRNHQVYSANYLGHDTRTIGRSGLSSGRIIYIVLMVIVFGARILFTCGGSNTDYTSSSFKYIPQMPVKEPDAAEKLKAMSEYCFFNAQVDGLSGLYANANPALLQGKNPFYFLADADDDAMPDSLMIEINLVNHTSYDLVVIRHHENFIHSNYIFKDSSMLYSYPKNYSLCFYAGSHWIKMAHPDALQAQSLNAYMYRYEGKFKNNSPNAKALFSTDYTIDLLGKKPKKKKAPYVAELTDEFIESGVFKNKVLQFGQVMYTVTNVPQ